MMDMTIERLGFSHTYNPVATTWWATTGGQLAGAEDAKDGVQTLDT